MAVAQSDVINAETIQIGVEIVLALLDSPIAPGEYPEFLTVPVRISR